MVYANYPGSELTKGQCFQNYPYTRAPSKVGAVIRSFRMSTDSILNNLNLLTGVEVYETDTKPHTTSDVSDATNFIAPSSSESAPAPPEGISSVSQDENLRFGEWSAKQRLEYLKRTEAIPVTAVMYAAWLYTYLKSGGKVIHQGSNIDRVPNPRYIEGQNAPTDQYYKHTDWWMPTKTTTMPIPVGYGAESMNLLIVPYVAKVSLEPGKDGLGLANGPEWEYGHTSVHVLREMDGFTWSGLGYTATTNRPDVVKSFTDADRYVQAIGNADRASRKKMIDLVFMR